MAEKLRPILNGEIDQHTANHLNKTGGSILCWDVPIKSYFGIDYLTFETGKKFKGVKMIPPGPHFINTSIKNAERMGFFVWIKGKQIDVYQWDETLKCLTDFQDKAQAERLKVGVRNFDFDSNLGTYPLQTFTKWQKLSCHINEHLISKLGPKSGIIASTYSEIHQIQKQINDDENNNDNDEEMKDQTRELNEKYNSAKSKFEHYHPKYTQIPSIKSLKNLKPSEITLLQMDRSKILYDILNKHYKYNHMTFLGEMQYAFICLLVGQSVQGLVQWKNIVDLLTNCCDALEEKQNFYLQFVETLMFQLKELPKDFFSDQLTNDNFLNKSLQSFMEIVNESQLNQTLSNKIEQLNKLLSKRFNKTIEIDTDGPTIVKL